ncbi:MAG: type II toxin-antitoxin system RelE/ParE family toxin [Azonexus sp.]|nr:type II toxin-antitoxin system RelE/ParE family toxin [Azonexus sp.]
MHNSIKASIIVPMKPSDKKPPDARLPPMKPLRFVDSSQKDLRELPANARHGLGVELLTVQFGGEPKDFKPMTDIGAGVYEIRHQDDSGAFRVIYVAKFAEAVYVLHAFQKKTQKTSKKDIDLAANRYRKLIGVRK